jgi:hypothetical protein
METNNLTERHFFSVKYTFLGGVANRRVSDLVIVLVNKAVPWYIMKRRCFTAGRNLPTNAELKANQRKKNVKALSKVMILANFS